jgi:hypothetical protein
MDTQFYIVFNVKTVNGPQAFGRFYIGDNRERASEIFQLLEGSPEQEKISCRWISWRQPKGCQ